MKLPDYDTQTHWVFKKCFLSIIPLLIWLYRVAIGLCVCFAIKNLEEWVFFSLISKDGEFPHTSQRAV